MPGNGFTFDVEGMTVLLITQSGTAKGVFRMNLDFITPIKSFQKSFKRLILVIGLVTVPGI